MGEGKRKQSHAEAEAHNLSSRTQANRGGAESQVGEGEGRSLNEPDTAGAVRPWFPVSEKPASSRSNPRSTRVRWGRISNPLAFSA